MQNPYVTVGCLCVDDYFKTKEDFMPFILYEGGPFRSVEEMKLTFADRERLEITEQYGVVGLRLKQEQ